MALKFTFDGCSLSNLGLSSIGGTIRDTQGVCIQKFSSPLGMGDASFAESKALLCGLRLISFLGLHQRPIEVEGDSSCIITWMYRRSLCPSRLSHIVKEALFIASSLNISFNWLNP